MTAHVLSVNLGASEPNGAGRGEEPVTGIGKRPVAAAELRAPGPKRGGLGSGLVGDFIGNPQVHGGDQQAVYAFAREELDHWAQRLGRPLEPGMFGENLTTEGLDVDDARVGDRWAVGPDVVLEVTEPRVPCATFADRMRVPGWVKMFTERGRTGAYLAIVSGGTVRPGDPLTVVHRADHDVILPLLFRAVMGDLEAARTVVDAAVLPEHDTEYLREQIQRRMP